MAGEYYCIAKDMNQGRFQIVTFYVTVMFQARFDHRATTVETLPDRKVRCGIVVEPALGSPHNNVYVSIKVTFHHSESPVLYVFIYHTLVTHL